MGVVGVRLGWQAIYLADNENCFVIVIPDAFLVSDQYRENIEFKHETRHQAQQAPAITRRATGRTIGSPAPLAPTASPGQTVAAGQGPRPQASPQPDLAPSKLEPSETPGLPDRHLWRQQRPGALSQLPAGPALHL